MSIKRLAPPLAACLLLSACAATVRPAEDIASLPLRELAQRRGIGIGSVADRSFRPGQPEDPRFRATLAREFNVLTPENDLKFQRLRPAAGAFDFTRADSLLAFAEAHGMRLRGHTLVWHRQLAPWLTQGSWTREQAEAQMAEHIAAVAGRYRGRLIAWDVVNEAIADDASLRQTFWSQNVGPQYIDKAFRMAHAADPEVPLFYNDYGIEGINAKSDAVYALVRDLMARGVPIHGIGFQAHMRAGSGPSREEMAANFKRFSDLGLKIHVTELDVRVRQPTTPEGLEAQARTYRDVVETCLGNAACDTVVLWGFTDADSWIPGANPGWGDALPWDAEYRPKPAYRALQQALGTR